MKLYHGSAYKVDILKPAYDITGIERKWDETESNRYLYFTTSKKDAVIFGLASYIENTVGDEVENLSFNYKENVVAVNCNPVPLTGVLIYLYDFVKLASFQKVNNAFNNYTEEYRIDGWVKAKLVSTIEIEKWLKENDIELQFTA